MQSGRRQGLIVETLRHDFRSGPSRRYGVNMRKRHGERR